MPGAKLAHMGQKKQKVHGRNIRYSIKKPVGDHGYGYPRINSGYMYF